MQTIVIIGICGKMGNHLYEFYKDSYHIIGVDVLKHPTVQTFQNLEQITEKIDVVIDFSSVECLSEIIYAIQHHIPILSGTTGYELHTIEELNHMAEENHSIFIWKANYARGIKLFSKLLSESKKEFDILDFVEIHATTKKDAPSGTAKVLAHELGIDESKIQSLRMNQAPAIHQIVFSSNEERVVLRHEIINKKAFLLGFDEELKKVLCRE